MSACVTTPAAREVRTTHLICAKTIPLDINHDGETAVVRNWQGKQLTLRRNPAVAGTRYEGSGAAVMRQDDIFIYIASDGSTHDCELLRI